LKLIFLIITRAVSLLGLSRREWWWKDAEILMLRHQLAVAERERPRVHSRLTWPDRAWLALLAGTVPAERLAAMRLIVTPGTILRWQRDIVRRRWARLSRRPRSGRPATHRKVRSVLLRLARENEAWGYRRIHGELAGLGIAVVPSTVWQILKSAGISPASAESATQSPLSQARVSGPELGPRRHKRADSLHTRNFGTDPLNCLGNWHKDDAQIEVLLDLCVPLCWTDSRDRGG
jgi:transposase